MNDEGALRLKAREAIEAGKLPNRHPESMWGGPGHGARCTVCDKPVEGDQLGFDLEFVRGENASGPGSYHVHVRCFATWEFERQNLEVARTAIAPSGAESGTPPFIAPATGEPSESDPGITLTSHVLPAAINDGTISACERDTYKRGPG